MNTSHYPLTSDAQVAQVVRFKARLIWEIRKYLHDLGALEIPMPILQRTREGAPIDQWSAIHPQSGQRWYLRHCMEDHLRRASAAHNRVFEIGKAIRADIEGPMTAHEFVVLELVFRGFGYEQGVDLVKELLTGPVAAVANAEYGMGEMFQRVIVRRWDEILHEATGLIIDAPNFVVSCESWLKSRGIVSTYSYTAAWEVLDDIMRYAIEPACVAPTIITCFPAELMHVCDINPSDGRAMRVSSVLHGVEISDGGVKLPTSTEYRRIYAANAEYRRSILGLQDNELPEEFFADLDVMNDHAFTTGLGIDRLTALIAGCHISRALIFPEG